MKHFLLFILLFAAYVNAQNGKDFMPDKADSITVSGKIILADSLKHTIYYLDTNTDNLPDYFLNFGPWWYQPDSSAALRPLNGDEVTITGGKFQPSMSQFPSIIVYEINGEFWRDPFFAGWNNMGHHNRKHGWMGNGKYHGGYGFGWGHDTLIVTNLSGTTLVDSTFHMKYYYLDTDKDSLPDYFLNFGPFWYSPESDAVRPVNGDSILIKGIQVGKDTTLPMVIVLEINGQAWRDSTRLFPHLGGRWINPNDSTGEFVSPFDYDDFIKFHKGWHTGNGHMNRDSIFCQMFESYPENMPDFKGHNFFAGYEVNVYSHEGHNGMGGGGRMNFANKIDFRFHYTEEQLKYYNMNEDKITVMFWNASTNTWENINGTVDKANNLVTFSSSTAGNYFALSSQSITTVNEATSLPVQYTLEQNYPNPFNPTTTIKYSVPADGIVSIKIYNILGNEIATIVNEYKNAGNYSFKFNAANLASGVYFYQMSSGNFSATKKLVLMK